MEKEKKKKHKKLKTYTVKKKPFIIFSTVNNYTDCKLNMYFLAST